METSLSKILRIVEISSLIRHLKDATPEGILEDREKKIIELRLQGVQYERIGRRLGISGSRVSQLHQRAWCKLANFWEQDLKSLAQEAEELRKKF